MFKKIVGLTLSAPFLFGATAFAGEFGVSNSYSQGWRAGTGRSWSEYTTNIQQTENYSFLSAKLDCSYYGGGSGYDASADSGTGIYEVISSNGGGQGNNGFGNGDQDAPGGSGANNNAENAGGGSQESSSNSGGSTGSVSGFGGVAGTGTGGGADYSVKSVAFAMTSGTGVRTQNTTASGGSEEVYSFGSSSFNHSVSSFAN